MRVQVTARLLLSPGPPFLDPEKTRPGNDLPYESHHNAFDRQIILITAAFLFLLLAILAVHALIRSLLRRFTSATAALHLPTSAPSKPMKKRHVSALPTSTVARLGGGAAQCPICLADFKNDDVLRVLPTCHHGFHVGCVDPWLYRQGTCPICRADLLKLREERSRSVEVHVVITPRRELCPTLCGDPKTPI